MVGSFHVAHVSQVKHQAGLIRLEYMLRRAKIDGKTDGKFEYIVFHMNFDDSPNLEVKFHRVLGVHRLAGDGAERAHSNHQTQLAQLSTRSTDSLTISMASAISFGDANSGFQAGIINGQVNAEFRLPPGKLRRAQARLALMTTLAKSGQKHHPARRPPSLSAVT